MGSVYSRLGFEASRIVVITDSDVIIGCSRVIRIRLILFIAYLAFELSATVPLHNVHFLNLKLCWKVFNKNSFTTIYNLTVKFCYMNTFRILYKHNRPAIRITV